MSNRAGFFKCLLGALFFVSMPLYAAEAATTSPKQIGFFCNPYISTFIEGEYYIPEEIELDAHTFKLNYCTYISPELDDPIKGRVNRYGGVFHGTVGDSVRVTRHSLGNADTKSELGDGVGHLNPEQGANFFAAIFQIRSNSNDLIEFSDFFSSGTTSPPHQNYGFLNWKYGTTTPAVPGIDPVIIIPGLIGSAQKNGVWVMDPILHTYDNLIDTLAANGYVEGKDLFPFPYDWRNSNITTAQYLKQRIDAIKEICGCEKVDIVAHSMGGLVARQYVQSPQYEDDVDQVIFLGVPHNGAPKAYLMWEAGENYGDLVDLLMKDRLSIEAKILGYDSLFDYIHSYPVLSLQEILPIYDYINGESYPNNYPQNTFLENLNGTKSSLSGLDIVNMTGDSGEDRSIVSYTMETSDELPLWEHGKPEGFSFFNVLLQNVPGIHRGVGDDTVPVLGSELGVGDTLLFEADHMDLPTVAEPAVYEELTGSEPEILVNNEYSTGLGVIFIQLLSPVDFYVEAPDGKKIGKNFETGEEYDEIENAFYSGYLTHDEYVAIPNPLDGEYKVVLQGTDDGGAYTVVSSIIQEATSTPIITFNGTTTPELITELNLNIDEDNPDGLEIIPEDQTPPTVDILSPEERNYTRLEALTISVEIHDEETGISTSEITLDGIIKNNGEDVDLFFEKLGEHILRADAADNVGNSTSSTTTFQLIATPESVIADIERAYDLGWITKENVKNRFIRQIERAVRIERRIEKLVEKLPNGRNIERRVERLEKRVDKVLARLLLKDLEREHSRRDTVNEEAYQLLKEDIEWLLNN